MNKSDMPKCSICGKVAHYGARDIIEIPSECAWKEYEPFGEWRYGCTVHPPAKSHIYNIGDADYPIRKKL